MTRVACACGAAHRFDDAAVGRKARCKACGAVFTIVAEDGLIPLAGAAIAADEAAAAATHARAHERAQTPLLGPGEARFDQRDEDRFPGMATVVMPGRGLNGRYVRAVGWAFLFFTVPSNLFTLIVLSALIALKVFQAFAGCWGLIAGLILEGWIAAFSLNVVLSAANGEEDLPPITLMEGFMEGIVVPFFKYLAVWVISMAPAMLYFSLVIAASPQVGPGMTIANYIDGAAQYGGFGGLLDALFQGPELLLFLLLFAGGLFILPILLLVVAVGGFGALVRVDLMAATIVRTLPGYVLCATLVIAAAAVPLAVSFLMRLVQPSIGTLDFVAAGVRAYATVVAMMAVGLHYHHYKERYAWDWG